MNTLFPIEPVFPPGFSYTENFLTVAEEQLLLKTISEIELHSFQFHGYEGKRRVGSFGYDWSFEKRVLSKGKEIPSAFSPLLLKVSDHLRIPETAFAELLVTEYPIGSAINWHRDAPPFDLIVGISLQADCAFRFRPHDKKKQGRGSIISFPVWRRSLYTMQGESREEWQHSTAPGKEVRYSITLRTLRKEAL